MSNDVCLAASERLRVVFERHGDRWAHRVELRLPDGGWITFSSDEGNPDDFWPPSPPLQSLELQELTDGRRIAFLVGMAGASHWSAAVEARRESDEIHFDIACRCTTEPTRLGCEYGVELSPGMNCDETADHFRVEHSTDGHCAWLDGNNRRILIAVEAAATPCTFRWRYAVSTARNPAPHSDA